MTLPVCLQLQRMAISCYNGRRPTDVINARVPPALARTVLIYYYNCSYNNCYMILSQRNIVDFNKLVYQWVNRTIIAIQLYISLDGKLYFYNQSIVTFISYLLLGLYQKIRWRGMSLIHLIQPNNGYIAGRPSPWRSNKGPLSTSVQICLDFS